MAIFLGSSQIDKINYQNICKYNYSDAEQFCNGTITTCQDFNLSSIDSYAFYNRSNLTSINFPNCSYIGREAFAGCSSLITINAPNCISMGVWVFNNCSALTTINLLNCSIVGYSAFQNCQALTSVNFPNCTSICNSAFRSCYSLAIANFPNCSYIGSGVFYDCSNLTSINFPNCTSIGNDAFYDCNIYYLYLSNCSYIGGDAFYSNNLLKMVYCPNCSYIGTWAFYYCRDLLSLYLTSVSSVPTLGNYAFSYTPIGGYTTGGVYGSVFVPSSLYNSFLTANRWSDIRSRIVGVGWSQVFSETAVVENQGTAWDTEGFGATLLVADWEYYGSNLNTIETAKITLNGITYICSNYITENDESFFGAFETTNGPKIDFADFQIYPFMLYYSSNNEYMALRLDPNKFSEDDEITINFEEQINYLP